MCDGTETDGITMDTQRIYGPGFAPAWHRPWFRYFAPVEGEGGGGEPKPEPKPEKQGAKTFTQGELDQIINDRLAQQAKNKFGDYDALKAAADGARTVEQQLAELSKKHTEAEARALRSDIASTYGISKEDRELFLTGSDEAALTAQAKRLADRAVDQKKNGNRAPKEGDTTTGADKNKDMREFTRGLFASAQAE